ncbi:MAG: glycosyltransferase family 4 protein [Pacificimonas sp.]
MSIYAINLLRQLVNAGHDVAMISQYRDDDFGRGVYGGGPPPDVPGVKIIGLEAKGEAESGDFERDIEEMVAAVVREHERAPFDVLHAQYGYPNGWAALLASKRTGVPNIVSIQGGDGHWVGSCCETHRIAMQRVLDHAGRILIGGESFAREVHERLGTAMDRFTFIPGAVDTGHFHPGTRRDTDDRVSLFYHGRVDRRKGVLDMLDALARLESQTAWRCTISGIGPDLEPAKRRARELGLDDHVRFTGYADYADVPDLYREHDIFLSPTYAEGFSNTILEAMASGLAIIAGRSVGVVDCLRDGANGLLVKPGNIEALSSAIATLVDDAGERRRLADATLAECRAIYSWEVVGDLIQEQYRAVSGEVPDLEFEMVLPVDECRFRAEPHLL